MRIGQWLAGTSLMVLSILAVKAQAQDAPAQNILRQPAPAATGKSSDQGPVLEEIIVTATKVASNMQRTPIAISAFDGDDLLAAGITSTEALNKAVPGIQVENSGGGASAIFIRGIGTRVLNAFGDPANAFTLDGVYLSRPAGPNAVFYDIERLEVVKGPQGTLYGRNATGGGINVITRRPTDEAGGEASLELGSYDLIRAQAALNAPLSEKIKMRIAGQAVDRDGYHDDGYDDEETKAARLSVTLDPSDSVSLFLSGDYAHAGGQGTGMVPVGPGNSLGSRFVNNDPFAGPSSAGVRAYTATAVAALNEPYILSRNGLAIQCVGVNAGPIAMAECPNPIGITGVLPDGRIDNDYYGFNATADIDVGFGTWTTIGGFRKTETDTRIYVGPAPQTQVGKANQWSLESRIASDTGGPLQWIAGAYYLNEKQTSRGQFYASENLASLAACVGPFPAPPATPNPVLCRAQIVQLQNSFTINLPDVENETWALFGQATYSLTDAFRLTAGLRYTEETKTSTGGISSNIYVLPANLVTSYATGGRSSFDDTSWRLGVEFDPAERVMVYASVATAYHAGGINLGVEQGPNKFRYEPEEVTAYTAGLKSRLLDNRLQLNLEGFYLDYTNLQVQGLGRINNNTPAGAVALRTDNAGKAHIAGVEADIQWLVGENGTFTANALWSDSEYKDFVIPGITGTIDASGLPLAGLSEWSVSAGYAHNFPLADGGEMVADIRSQYRNGTWMWFTHEPGNYQKAYTSTNVSLTYRAPENAWSLTGYVRNLEDKATVQQGYNANVQTGVPWVGLNAPRTWGVIASVKF